MFKFDAYALTVEEAAMCANVGWKRQAAFLAQPERNVNYFEGDMWEALQHMICSGAELAVAQMLGLDDFVPHVNKFKSEWDIPEKCEVRYSFPKDFPQPTGEPRGLRITNRDADDVPYVLVTGGEAFKVKRTADREYKGAPYIARGWAYAADAKRDDWRFNEKTWYIPLDGLRSLDSFPG